MVIIIQTILNFTPNNDFAIPIEKVTAVYQFNNSGIIVVVGIIGAAKSRNIICFHLVIFQAINTF